MSLTAAMLASQSALHAAQAGIQVAANNIANAATPGYSRQVAHLSPIRGVAIGNGGTIGRGVIVQDVRRQVNEALLARSWGSMSEHAAAEQRFQSMSAVESALNELSGFDLSSELAAFFNAWSERANLTESSAVVVQRGLQLADSVRRLRSDLGATRAQIDGQLAGEVAQASSLLDRIAEINRTIADAEQGVRTANDLRDQRDLLVGQLAEMIDVNVVEQPDGRYDVLIGSSPVVLGGTARGLEMRQVTIDGVTQVRVTIRSSGQEVRPSGGRIGGLLTARGDGITRTIDALDTVATQLIFAVNGAHATGTNASGLPDTSSELRLSPADRSLALNDPANSALASLPFVPRTGGFLVNVRHVATGLVQSVRIGVDLDGITASGTSGFADDTSAESIAAALNAVGNLSAGFTPDGRLRVAAGTGYDFSFSDDTSGVLATLGVNAFFTGRDASDVGVRSDLAANPSRLMTGAMVDGRFVENATALRIAGLQDTAIEGLGGRTLRAAWSDAVQTVAVSTQAAQLRAEAARVVRDSLDAQRASVSGVSLDEESMNLLNFQKQYQGAARVIALADQLLDSLMSIL